MAYVCRRPAGAACCCCLGCVSLPGQVGDRCNCEFWPSRVPTYPHSQLAARSAAIPTYPPSGAEFRERPPSGRAQRYLPTLARRLPAPRPYLPTLAQVFPIAAVTYLPGQRDATLLDSHAHSACSSRALGKNIYIENFVNKIVYKVFG